ncbi:MAG: hypothetical protein Q8M57_16155 [Nitrosomonas sp.]|uniref:hypothetical protein n=1 Tax=Nitrosomonas sp. TaxID=42353 RepID=UPI0027341BBC|nr:hypothetical protein [Nitrosomonas sp.]MDP3282545.1 hypothetical protein [Nitrosomonas sp.]
MRTEEHLIVEIDYPDAKYLAAYHSIFRDLMVAEDAVDRLLSMDTNSEENRCLIESLYISALVSYIRGFTSGKRAARLSTDIFSKLDGAEVVHNYFKDIRDKHIAHSVNPFEQVKVGVRLTPKTSNKKEVISVGVLSLDRICECHENLVTLKRLIGIAKEDLLHKILRKEEQILDQARQENIADLYEKSVLEIVVPGGLEDARSARKTYT